MERGIEYQLATNFIDFFRTIPEMVLIFWVYSCLPLLFDLRLSAETCGILALSLYSGAFLAEIFRAGILAVPREQIEGALALGLPKIPVWRFVILPQAIRRMMPAFVNFLTELIKASSLLSAIGITELVYQASTLGAQTFRYVEFLSAIALLYFLIILPFSLYSRRSEMVLVRRTGQ
jgi:ABC-type amino acid transport system permease subunit